MVIKLYQEPNIRRVKLYLKSGEDNFEVADIFIQKDVGDRLQELMQRPSPKNATLTFPTYSGAMGILDPVTGKVSGFQNGTITIKIDELIVFFVQ